VSKVDWSRERGDTGQAFQELLTAQKERVFAQGREYQTRTGPSMRLATLSSGYSGSHSQRLAEEETLTRRRQETMQQINRQRNQDERERKESRAQEERHRMEQKKNAVIDKYTNSSNRRNDPRGGHGGGGDVLRLG